MESQLLSKPRNPYFQLLDYLTIPHRPKLGQHKVATALAAQANFYRVLSEAPKLCRRSYVTKMRGYGKASGLMCPGARASGAGPEGQLRYHEAYLNWMMPRPLAATGRFCRR